MYFRHWTYCYVLQALALLIMFYILGVDAAGTDHEHLCVCAGAEPHRHHVRYLLPTARTEQQKLYHREVGKNLATKTVP